MKNIDELKFKENLDKFCNDRSNDRPTMKIAKIYLDWYLFAFICQSCSKCKLESSFIVIVLLHKVFLCRGLKKLFSHECMAHSRNARFEGA